MHKYLYKVYRGSYEEEILLKQGIRMKSGNPYKIRTKSSKSGHSEKSGHFPNPGGIYPQNPKTMERSSRSRSDPANG